MLGIRFSTKKGAALTLNNTADYVIEAIETAAGLVDLQILPFEVNLKDFSERPNYPMDLGWIKGQESYKRALEIAAAGGHNIFLKGPPGAGKTMLARALPGILPELTEGEALEVTKTTASLVEIVPCFPAVWTFLPPKIHFTK